MQIDNAEFSGKTVIFLDIDGVLNSQNGYVKRSFNMDKPCRNHPDIHEDNLEPFLHLLEKLGDVDIVISSSHRIGWDKVEHLADELFHNYDQIRKRIVGMTPRITDAYRGVEIMQYLVDHKPVEYNQIIILDDGSDMWILKEFLYRTSTEVGLNYYDMNYLLVDMMQNYKCNSINFCNKVNTISNEEFEDLKHRAWVQKYPPVVKTGRKK